MAAGKDAFKVAYQLGTTPAERAQESALQARLEREGEMGGRQKYLKLNAKDAEDMNQIRLTKSSTNFKEFTHSGLKGMTPDEQIYRSMKGHFKFVGGQMVGEKVNSFLCGELHINRIPGLGLGRSGIGSWISTGLHMLVDGETHFAPSTYLLESIRNMAVDMAEAGYQVRGSYVY